MTERSLSKLSDNELIELFAASARSHGNAVINGDLPVAKKSYWKLKAAHDELSARGDQSRINLNRLFDHSELTVRYYAATWLLALEPARARVIIEDVSSGGPSALAGDARMTLRMLDDGSFKPS
ncbi:hypothetical protein GCM10011611_67100 [Aliidongia dinghuensis]|uniref:DUF2019 domain-containing protein n=1 Tax=Aliidongia dinghuensis TaxID=1867774 RepID=A0A8J2Z1S2_9PROT|nr:DUF2019 domain-containing protein [Aliidongia dinghuensis]GGF51237.1 hypothetical protein GCM10011611_67100 [Aliidongia dinghuensis]